MQSSGQTKDISSSPAPTETEPVSDVDTLKAITVSCRTQHTLALSLFSFYCRVCIRSNTLSWLLLILQGIVHMV